MKSLSYAFLACLLMLQGAAKAHAADSQAASTTKATVSSKTIEKTTKPNSPVFESKEAAASAAGTCTWEGQEYKKGETRCKNKVEFECGSNGWFKTGKSC